MILDSIEKLVGKNFTELLTGSFINIFAKVFATAIGFTASIILARFYGADTIGIIATVTSIFTLGAHIALLGTDTLLLKLVPQHLKSHGTRAVLAIYTKTAAIACTAGLLVSLLVASNVFNIIPSEVNPILPAILLLASALVTINSTTLRAMGDFKLYSILDTLPPLAMLSIVGLGIYLSIGKEIFVYLYFLSIALVLMASFILLKLYFSRRKIQPVTESEQTTRVNTPNIANMLKISTPMLGVSLSVVAIQHIDVLSIGHFLDHNAVGVYAIYTKLAAIVTFATFSINSMFAPKVAVLYKHGNQKELKTFVKRTTGLLFASSIFIAVVLLVVQQYILSLYGEIFLQDTTSLYILIFTAVLNSFFGSTGFFLNMTGGQNSFFWIMLLAAAMNLIGNLILIPIYGITGAALASMLSVLAWNVLAMVSIKRNHGFTIFFYGRGREK